MRVETIDIKSKKGMQEIVIPQQMKIDDDKVYIKKVGNSIFIIPFHNPWQNLIDSTHSFTSDFMENRDQPDIQHREMFD
ncbi:MAG: AbrB/MazE/SpoVT family DNA-binding domain-containing protein [Bacteroidota bacterium]